MNIEFESALLWIRTVSDWGMLFLIWVVQLYIYPSFRKVRLGKFPDWHKRYMRRIAWLVGPLMAGQVVAGLGFMYLGISPASVLYMTLVAATWILTGLVAAPLHEKLQESGKALEIISRLIAWNWARTIIWTGIVFL